MSSSEHPEIKLDPTPSRAAGQTGTTPHSIPLPGTAPELPRVLKDAIDEDAEALLVRMRSGDRQAVGEFVDRYGSRIRRRVRAKLSPSMRRIFDSQEMLSTLARRLDQFVRDRRMTADNQARLWALVGRISDNALIDKARLFKRISALESPDGPAQYERGLAFTASDPSTPVEQTVQLDQLVAWISDDRDKQILTLWLHDVSLGTIAEYLQMSPAAVRKRWQLIRERLRERLAPHL